MTKKESSTPEVLKDEKTRIAAITMISLGAISLTRGLTAVDAFSHKPLTAISLGISGIIIGNKLLQSQSDENKNQAKILTLSAGIIAAIHGLADFGMLQSVKVYGRILTEEDIHYLKPEQRQIVMDDYNKAAKAFNRRSVKRLGMFSAIGAGLIYASQTAFDLADSTDTPVKTLGKINQLIASYN